MSKNIFLYDKITAQNNLKVTTLNITSLTPNSLVQTDANDNLISLANGTSNQILNISPTTGFPEYSSNINVNQVQTNSLIVPGFSAGNLFVDGSGNLFTEIARFTTSGVPITFTTSTLIYSYTYNITNYRSYKVSVSFNNLITTSGSNTYTVEITSQTSITYVTSNTSSQENVITAFQANFSGTCTVGLVGAHTGSGNGTASKVCIIIEPLGYAL